MAIHTLPVEDALFVAEVGVVITYTLVLCVIGEERHVHAPSSGTRLGHTVILCNTTYKYIFQNALNLHISKSTTRFLSDLRKCSLATSPLEKAGSNGAKTSQAPMFRIFFPRNNLIHCSVISP